MVLNQTWLPRQELRAHPKIMSLTPAENDFYNPHLEHMYNSYLVCYLFPEEVTLWPRHFAFNYPQHLKARAHGRGGCRGPNCLSGWLNTPVEARNAMNHGQRALLLMIFLFADDMPGSSMVGAERTSLLCTSLVMMLSVEWLNGSLWTRSHWFYCVTQTLTQKQLCNRNGWSLTSLEILTNSSWARLLRLRFETINWWHLGILRAANIRSN